MKMIHLLMEREADKAFIVSQGIHDPCGKLNFVFLGKYLTYHGTCPHTKCPFWRVPRD